jgi:hypothetical protein
MGPAPGRHDHVDDLNLVISVFAGGGARFLNGSLVDLLDDFQNQSGLINGLEVSIGAFHDLLADKFVEFSNEYLDLEELSSVDQGVAINFLEGSICPVGLLHVIGLAGCESLKCLDVPGKVGEDGFS